MSGVEVNVLQGWQLCVAGREVRLPYDKCQALLVWLLLNPDCPLQRGVLADLLWPESVGDPRNNLRRTLYELRKALGEQADTILTINRREVILHSDALAAVDLWEFEEAHAQALRTAQLTDWTRAFNRYKEGLLPNLLIDDAIEFSLRLEGVRVRLRRMAINAAARLCAGLEAQRNPLAALEVAHRWLMLCPEDDQACIYALRLAQQCGDPALGWRMYEMHQRALVHDLGLQPSDEVVALFESLTDSSADELHVNMALVQPAQVDEYHRRWMAIVVCDPGTDAAPLVLEQTRQRVTTLLEAYCGTVERMPTGEVVGYFGYPATSDSQTERALRSCQAISEVLGERVRSGMDIGWTISDRQGRADVIGRLLRGALHLAGQAAGGAVWVSPAVVDALSYTQRSAVHMRALPSAHFELDVSRRFVRQQLFLIDTRVPLVGRDVELSELRGWWRAPADAKRGLAWLQGEAGLGKSRLVAELLADGTAGERDLRLLICRPELQHMAYGVFIKALQHYAGIVAGQPREESHRRLVKRTAVLGLESMLPVAETLLELRPPGAVSIQAIPLTTERITDSLTLLLEQLSRKVPLMMVIEDGHWLDDSSREVLIRLGSRLPPRVGMLITSRESPERFPIARQWQLRPLAVPQVRKLFDLHLRSIPQTAANLAVLMELAEGNPFFVEELAAHQGNSDQVPASLRSLLHNRLHLLAEALPLAQVGSLLGRAFRRAELLALLGEERVSESRWQQLRRSGLFEAEPSSVDSIQFRHALLREAATESLSDEERRHWHGSIVDALSGPWAEHSSERWPELALHAEAAFRWPEAVFAWRVAAQRSHRRGEYVQAMTQVEHAEAALQSCLPTLHEQNGFVLEGLRGSILLGMEGYGSSDARRAFERALDLHASLDSAQDRFGVLWGIWGGGRGPNESCDPLYHAQSLWREARRSNRRGQRLAAHYALGNNLFWTGQFHRAIRHLRAAVRLSEAGSPEPVIETYGEDIGISARAILAWGQWFIGEPEQALATCEHNLACARHLDHPHSLGFALAFCAGLAFLMHQPQRIPLFLDELEQLMNRYDLPLWQASSQSLGSWMRHHLEDDVDSRPLLQAIEICRQVMPAVEGFFQWVAADAAWQRREHLAMHHHINQALSASSYSGDQYHLPSLYMLRAADATSRGEHATAEREIQSARRIAAEQGSAVLELRLLA